MARTFKRTQRFGSGTPEFQSFMRMIGGFDDPPMVFSMNFSDVIKNQVYLNFFGITVASTRDSLLLNYETGADGAVIAEDNTDRICQTFTTTEDIYVKTIEFYGKTIGSSTDVANVEIQTTSGGEPTGIELKDSQPTNSGFTTSDDWVTFNYGSVVRLKAGVVYALVFRSDTSIDHHLRADTSSPTYAGGSVGTSGDSGSTWSMDTAKDLYFRINGTTSNPYNLFPASGISSDTTTTTASTVAVAEDDLLSDIDFDFEVQHTIAVKGLALLEIDTTGGYDVITLYKYDGTTETQLATASTDSAILVGLDIATQTTIKRGDILRLNIQMKADAAGAIAYTLKHSGANLKLSIPVKLIGDI